MDPAPRQAHLNHIQQNWWQLAATAYQAHQDHGPGVMVILAETADFKRDQTAACYLRPKYLRKFIDNRSYRDLQRMVKEYDPTHEVVICVLGHDGESIYRAKLPNLTPEQAFEQNQGRLSDWLLTSDELEEMLKRFG